MNIERVFIREKFVNGSTVRLGLTSSVLLRERSSGSTLGDEGCLSATLLSRRSYDVSYANESVDGIGKGKHPSATLQPFVPDLPEQANRFQPSKGLFDKLSFPLTDLVARMARSAPIQSAPSSALRILGCMGRNVQASHLLDKLFSVIVFVSAKRQTALSFPFHLLHHRGARRSFCRPGCFGVRSGNDQSMSVIHHHMTQKGQLGLFALPLSIESGFRVCGRLMSVIRSFFSMKTDRGIPRIIGLVRRVSVFLGKALLARR
jgi:hypothetical protein